MFFHYGEAVGYGDGLAVIVFIGLYDVYRAIERVGELKWIHRAL